MIITFKNTAMVRNVLLLIAVLTGLFLLQSKADTIEPADVTRPTPTKAVFCEAVCNQQLVEVCSAKYNACTEIPAQFCLGDVGGKCEYIFVSF